MKLALIHPDPAPARELAQSLAAEPDFRLLWSVTDVAAAQGRPLPALLLVEASRITPALVRDWVGRGSAVAVLVAQAGSNTNAVYAALDAGALGHAVLADAAGVPALLARLRRWAMLVPKARGSVLPTLIALGASAGGPQALKQVLAGLAPTVPAAVVVALHYDRAPAQELATWLQESCSLPITVARPGQMPVAGKVVVADSGGHLELAGDGAWAVTASGASDPVCPSVDRLFCSLARHAAGGAAALLSGMGQDGAAGLLALRQAGWLTVAQDAGSSRVWGMPRAAVEAGAAVRVLPLDQIAAALVRALNSPESA